MPKRHAQRLKGPTTAETDALETLPLSDHLALNVQTLRDLFAQSVDWVLREFRIAGGREAAITYLDGLVDKQLLGANVLKPLLYEAFPVRTDAGHGLRDILPHHVIVHSQIATATTMRAVVDAILHADAVLLVDGTTSALIVSTRGFARRSIDEPPTEAAIRGPREAFVEGEGELTENPAGVDMNDPRVIWLLEDEIATLVAGKIRHAVQVVQRQFGADVLGFGAAVKRADPQRWETLKDHWNERFSEVELEIDIKTSIRRTGMSTNSMGSEAQKLLRFEELRKILQES